MFYADIKWRVGSTLRRYFPSVKKNLEAITLLRFYRAHQKQDVPVSATCLQNTKKNNFIKSTYGNKEKIDYEKRHHVFAKVIEHE